jgi:hypothetical protein
MDAVLFALFAGTERMDKFLIRGDAACSLLAALVVVPLRQRLYVGRDNVRTSMLPNHIK